ncbi:MAG: hypothetical protein NTW60_01095, partial [Candidatus Wolfebacteria bacterium]|nr:hypothetical protein [Candidatus Wolfebacteria bacterium]
MFNLNTIEQDIERLSREVKEFKNLPENKDLAEREIVKQAIQPVMKPVVAPQNTSAQTVLEEDSVLPDYLKDSSTDIKLKVEKLLEEVFKKGVEKAAEDAIKAGPFILDAFHDALT